MQPASTPAAQQSRAAKLCQSIAACQRLRGGSMASLAGPTALGGSIDRTASTAGRSGVDDPRGEGPAEATGTARRREGPDVDACGDIGAAMGGIDHLVLGPQPPPGGRAAASPG